MTVSDAAFGEVVGRHLDLHLVAGEDFDVVHAHLATDVCGDLVPVFELNAEHGVAEGFDDGSVKLYGCLFCHS